MISLGKERVDMFVLEDGKWECPTLRKGGKGEEEGL